MSQPDPLSGSAYLRLVALGAVIGIASLLVGTAGLDAVPAAVLAACAAWITAQALDRRMAARQAPEAGLPVTEPG